MEVKFHQAAQVPANLQLVLLGNDLHGLLNADGFEMDWTHACRDFWLKTLHAEVTAEAVNPDAADALICSMAYLSSAWCTLDHALSKVRSAVRSPLPESRFPWANG